MTTAETDTAPADLLEQRAFLCRLTPDRALETLDDAETFLRDRGMLTRTPDCSLPSLFEACHEEPYRPGKGGFAEWPRTKWSWSFTLPSRPGVYAPKVHHRRKTLYVSADTARIIDPIIRAEIERMRANDPDWARILDHLAAAGASTVEDLRTELGLKPRELKSILYPLELCGTVLTRAIEPRDDEMVEGFEYVRWDDAVPAADGAGGFDELLVAAVRAAVVAREREVRSWFSWPSWRKDDTLVDPAVSAGRLERPAPGWLALPTSA